MPFAITCPGCGKAFRSATERPEGKGVECPKCGEQFHVTKENQAEATSGPPPVPENRGPDTDDRRSKRRRDEEPAADAPGDGFSDDEWGRKPKRRSRAKLVVALGLMALLLLGAAATGAYFLFFKNPSRPPQDVASRIKPQREVPTELFLYWTGTANSDCQLRYYNLTEIRDRGGALPDRIKDFEEWVPPGSSIRLDDVAQYSIGSENMSRRYAAIRLAQPRTAADIAAAWGAKAIQVEGKTAYEKLEKKANDFDAKRFVLFQPSPSCLVVTAAETNEVLKYWLNRTVENHKPAVQALELVKEVSGYPTISLDHIHHLPSPVVLTVTGRDVNPGGKADVFRVRLMSAPLTSGQERDLIQNETKANKGSGPPRTDWFTTKRQYTFFEGSPTRSD